ncbi:mitochondrial outer membrane protein [Histoplasma capsulatum var. duboisii H88]|uniref:Mitochondrial outer membrane protein n=1 Tax=Ajellomyces capsulatus (strain H88) TaxID=544711 RepID=A0A8A1LJP1_AJEC8|nr:mitochondrial outer membrane protein [Histoplasma capsulatum var. duboisii H88]
MSEDEPLAASHQAQTSSRFPARFPSVPVPIKQIFDKFPLITYPANELPRRITRRSAHHALYIFTTSRAAERGAPSFNPQCLKWQAYLKFVGISFETVPSNNHASPTGALPFLIPTSSATPVPTGPKGPIPSNKIQKWAIEQSHIEEEQQLNMLFDVYTSLLDHNIRNAWLYTFYLDCQNFNAIGRNLYIDSSTSNPLVRTILARQLQQAARDELLKSSSVIDVDDLEAEAKNAFEALASLLGNDNYFFGSKDPGLFDASVFAYTHLLLDDALNWKRNPIGRCLKKYSNLVQHRERIRDRHF